MLPSVRALSPDQQTFTVEIAGSAVIVVQPHTPRHHLLDQRRGTQYTHSSQWSLLVRRLLSGNRILHDFVNIEGRFMNF